MKQKRTIPLTTIMFTLILLSACSAGVSTQDWEVFTIEEEPAINIQFRLPPDWQVNHAPVTDPPGQWEVALAPPRCSDDQEIAYENACVNLSIHIKDRAAFDREEFLTLISQDIPLTQTGSVTSTMLGQREIELDDVTVQRFDHRVITSEQDAQMSIFFFETGRAYFTFFTNVPYGERDGNIAATFDLLLGSIEVVE